MSSFRSKTASSCCLSAAWWFNRMSSSRPDCFLSEWVSQSGGRGLGRDKDCTDILTDWWINIIITLYHYQRWLTYGQYQRRLGNLPNGAPYLPVNAVHVYFQTNHETNLETRLLIIYWVIDGFGSECVETALGRSWYLHTAGSFNPNRFNFQRYTIIRCFYKRVISHSSSRQKSFLHFILI